MPLQDFFKKIKKSHFFTGFTNNQTRFQHELEKIKHELDKI